MTTLGHELRLVHNPALGAVLLWRFVRSYSDTHQFHASAPLPLAALVLPMVWHSDTLSHITSNRAASGLRALADKFTDDQLDILLALHRRASRWRSKTENALRMGICTGIIRLSSEGGLIAGDPNFSVNTQTPGIRVQIAAAEKLGAWFSVLSIREISLTLNVRF
jgi:hypothetical protein